MKIGVVGNCQVYGYVNCLSVLLKDGKVVGTPGPKLAENRDSLEDCDVIYAAPEFIDNVRDTLGKVENIQPLPMVFFDRYHPDMTYARDEKGAFKGVLDNYHSLICLAACKAGRSEEEALRLYNENTYALLGYLSGWEDAARKLLDAFEELELDIAGAFVRWSRRRAFMYTFNHPRIECLFDIARAVLRRDGIAHHDWPECPVHDNLTQGVHFAVYPEVARRYGVAGSYLFKLFHQYRAIDLREMVRRSYAIYAQHDMGKVGVSKFRHREFNILMEALENGRI